MPLTPEAPFPKERGQPLRSRDWNQLVTEVQRLDTDKINKKLPDSMRGPLTIETSLGIGIGSAIPRAALHIVGGQWDPTTTEGDLRIGSDTFRLKIGVATGGSGAGDVRIRAHGGTNRLMLGSGTTDPLTVYNNNVGVNNHSPAFTFHQFGGEHVIEDAAITLRRAGLHRWKIEELADSGLRITQVHNDAGQPLNLSRLEVNNNGALLVHGDLVVGGKLAAVSNNFWHRVQSDTDSRYGYFEARRNDGQRGFFLGWGSPGNYIDFALEASNNLAITGGRVGIGTNAPNDLLDVAGVVRILTGSNPLRFTSVWTAFPDAVTNQAEICNDTSGHRTLMIVGNRSAGLGRRVSVWDRLEVNGPLIINGGSQNIQIGVHNSPYAADGIRGVPNLWLDAAEKVFIKAGFQTHAMDVAERFQTLGPVEAGQVVVMDAQKKAVKPCDRAYDHHAIGIVSTEPGLILGIEPEDVPIALCGRVPCFVDADIAPIAVGDLLTTSSTSGHAQKVLDRSEALGSVIGKALEPLEQGKGIISVFIMSR